MNRLSNTLRLCLPAGILLAMTVALTAQAPRYTPPPPPTKGVKLEVRIRYMLPPDISFGGLGNIPVPSGLESETDILLGSTRSIEYMDGYIRQDFVEADLVAGSADGGQFLPSSNTDATSNYGFRYQDQVDPNDPSMLLFHRYSSVASPDAVFEGDNSSALGWEISYTKYLRRNRNIGIQVGFSFNGFDSRFNDSVSADLYVQEYQHQMAGGIDVPDMPDPIENDDGSIIQPPYLGDVVREEVDSGDLLEWVATGETEEWIEGGATVDTKADLRSSLYNFRAGPTYQIGLGQRFGIQLGVGVSAIYYSGEFSAYEALTLPTGADGPSRDFTTSSDAEWQVGGYVDASAQYNFTDRINLFSGMQVQSGSTYSQQNEDRHASVDFSSQIYVHAGMGIRF